MREINPILSRVPKEILPYLSSLTDKSGHSGALTFHSSSGYYLKIDEEGKLKHEAEMIGWFDQRKLGVNRIEYISDELDYLLTSEAIGQDATHWLEYPEQVIKKIVIALKQLHQVPIATHPVKNRTQLYLDYVEKAYHERKFDNRKILSKYSFDNYDDAWQYIQEFKDLLKNDVIIHGDYCLPNIILNKGEFSAFIDVGLSGVSDKHLDLYWLLWSVAYNLGTERYHDYILDAYGRASIDERVLRLIAACECFDA